jgi:hypothetical protein
MTESPQAVLPPVAIGGNALLYYRLYFLSQSNGRILRFAEFEALEDEAAIALAAEHQGTGPLELWCRQRKVKRFDMPEEQRKRA